MNLFRWSKAYILDNWKLIVCVAIVLIVAPLATNYILSPIKYLFFAFIGALTLLLIVMLFSPNKYLVYDARSVSNKIDYLFIGFSLFAVISNSVSQGIQELNLIISEALVFFVPGWFVLRLFRMDKLLKSLVGLIVFSFMFSVGISSLVFMLGLISHTTSALISVIYLVLSITVKFAMYRRESADKAHTTTNPIHKINLTTLLLLIWVSLFFAFTIGNLYPKLADIPGNDIVRHMSSSNELLRSPQLYTSEYPWFHFSLALTKTLSSAPDWMMQVGTGFLSIILILSFYLMANRYLCDIDPRAPILSTVFFTVFAGFGWLYFLLHFDTSSIVEDYFKTLSLTNSATYWDIGFGGSTWLWFWFRPLTVGFSLLFTCLYLLRLPNFPKIVYIPSMAFLVLIMSQTHISELVIFIGIIFTSCAFLGSSGLRLKDSIIAILLGLGLSLLVSNSIPPLLNSNYQIPQNGTLLQLIVGTLLSGVALKLPRKRYRIPSVNIFLTSAVGIFIFLVFLLSWLNIVDNNALQKISAVLAVPWEFYPVLLGVLGLLTIPSIFIVLRDHRTHPVIIFVVLFFLSIIFGRIVTYFNLEIGGLGYWERRTVPFVLVSVSILSTVFLLAFIREPLFKKKALTHITKITVVSCLVLFGTFSTLLSMQFQLYSITTNAIKPDERRLQDSLKSMGPEYTVLTANSRASNLVEYYNPGYLIGYYKVQVWPSKSPELPIRVMSILDNKSGIYLNSGDSNRTNQGGFVASHQIRMGQSTDPNQEGFITLPRMVPPVSTSNVALVLPNELSSTNYYAYDILSVAGINYTTIKLSDVTSLNKSETLVAPTETIGGELKNLKKEYNLKFHNLIILNLDGFSELSRQGQPMSSLSPKDEKGNWFAEGINNGSISVPSLKINGSASGDELLSVKVSNGHYALWQIYHKFETPVNLANFDLFNFFWYGKNDGKFYVVEFNAQDGGSFWYRFEDVWNGWKQVSLPLHQKNGKGTFFGLDIDIVASTNASWNQVSRINIRTEASNLNNSGTFYIKGLSLGSKLESSGIDILSSGETFKFPTRVEIFPVSTFGSSIVTAVYGNATVPYLMVQNTSTLSTWYVNIYPIINTMENNVAFAKMMYPELGNLLFVNLPKYQVSNKDIRTLVTGSVSAFRSLHSSGTFVGISDSAILLPSSSVKINIDGIVSTLNGVESISPLSEDYSIVKGNNMSTTRGYGFYFSALLNDSSISYYGHPARISIVSNDFKKSVYSGNNITITTAKSAIVLRQPELKISGTLLFDDLYAYGDLNAKIRSLGNDVKISGAADLVVQTSDEFTVAQNTTISGPFIRDPPLYSYDDLHNLSQLFDFQNIRHIFAISIILIIISMVFNAKKSRLREANSSNV